MADDNNKHLTPVWIVYVDGTRLDTDHEGALQKIVINDKLNNIGTASLEFDSSAVKIRDSGTFSLESEVSIHLGYKDDCELVFTGEVTGFNIQLNEYGHEQLVVTCSNCLYKLKNAVQSLSFESKALSDILQEIIDNYSLSAQIDSFGTTKSFTVENLTTDYDYLMKAAKTYGKSVYAYESDIYIKDEITVNSSDVIMEWGKSLISFSGTESLDGQLSECTFTGWDEVKCEAITGTATLNDLPLKVGGSNTWENNSKGAGGKWKSTYTSGDLFDNDDAKNRAIGILMNKSFNYQTCIAKSEGNYNVHPGMRVTMKYVGEKYSGEYIADRVVHEFSSINGYTTTIYGKRNASE